MEVSDIDLSQFFTKILPHLDERQRRLVAGAASSMLGRGGDSAVARAAGMARNTVAAGRAQSGASPKASTTVGVRRHGAGRRHLTESHPDLAAKLATLLRRGEADSSLLEWTLSSTYDLAQALTSQGIEVSPAAVGQLLHARGFELKGPGRLAGRRQRCEIESQLMAVAGLTARFGAASLPVVEVRAGTRCPEPGSETPADDGDPALAMLSTEAVRRWWQTAGEIEFPGSPRMLICSASFGSPGQPAGEWEHALTQLADQTGMEVITLHVPSVTRRWRCAQCELTELVTVHRPEVGPASFEISVHVLRDAGSHDHAGTDCSPSAANGTQHLPRTSWHYRAAPMCPDDHDRLSRTAAPLAPVLLYGSDAAAPAGQITRLVVDNADARERKTAENVAHEIVRDISARQLRPGDQLPALTTATGRYHVSNSCLRESLRILEALGVVNLRQGRHGGVVVRQVTTEDLALTSTFYYHNLGVVVRDLLDARAALEPILVRHLAQRQPPPVMRRLRWHVSGIGQEDLSGQFWLTRRSPTASFHRSLVTTGNPAIDLAIHSLQECWLSMRGVSTFPRDLSHHDRDHVMIAQAILDGAAEEAEKLMQRHMDYVSAFAVDHFSELMEQVVDWR